MEITLRVQRFNPEAEQPNSYVQEYAVDLEPSDTVLDGLIKVRETQDDSLALRCSCRGAICGSCGMRINGHASLACKTNLASLDLHNRTINVAPMNNMPVIKDLVMDMNPFWSQIRQVTPWLQPSGPPPQQEYQTSANAMTHLAGVMGCIMCGVCVSDCASLEVNPAFVGPAALAKAYRFVADPRDHATPHRLLALNEPGGMWDCTRCMECVQVCPKGVAPMDHIMALRAKGMEAKLPSTCGSRHAEVFTDLIRKNGLLDEPMLALRTLGVKNIPRLLALIPVALRAMLRRKLPPSGPFHRAISGIEGIRRLMAKGGPST